MTDSWSAGRQRGFWYRLASHKAALPSLFVIALLVLASLAEPLVAQWLDTDATAVNLLALNQGPSWAHPLGTDELGRDLLLRLLNGGRVSLSVAILAAMGSAVIGASLGLIAGYVGGRFDAFLMRVVDIVIALPLLPLLIIMAALDPVKLGLPQALVDGEHASFWRLIALIVLFGWTTVARLVRGATLSLREREFVRAAEALGASMFRVMVFHLLPNVISPIIVATTLSIGNIILLESVLSFLGLGIQPPQPSWGNMLTGAQELIWTAPQLAVWPGALIFVTVICFNLFGDALQDAFEPRR